MYVITLSLIICLLKYVSCIYDTGFNHLTEIVLEITSDTKDQLLSTKTRWIRQPIDHFDENSQTWKMRYFERLHYFRTEGPVYVFLGGEGEANSQYLSAGVIKELAQETGGAMFMTEHRYYGASKPFDDLNTKNMKWLSSIQALADIANVIKTIKSKAKFAKSKVVVIGGSYAGNLAAWMRLKYPEFVDSAIASSGPVLAKKDFYNYLEKVNEDYEQYGTPNCLGITRAMFLRYIKMLQSPQDTEKLKQEFNICRECDLSVTENQWIFFSWQISTYMFQSQYGGPDEIKMHCSYLENSHESNRSMFLRKPLWNIKNCIDLSFEGFIEYINSKANYLAWFYQVCTEFGYFQTTSSRSQPFGNVLPKEFYLEICKNLFGPEFNDAKVDEGVKRSNDMYGGLTPHVTGVVFVNGDVDPWSTISVLKDLSDEAPAVVIHKATHCNDLFVNNNSSEELKEANKYIKNVIKTWIGARDDDLL